MLSKQQLPWGQECSVKLSPHRDYQDVAQSAPRAPHSFITQQPEAAVAWYRAQCQPPAIFLQQFLGPAPLISDLT